MGKTFMRLIIRNILRRKTRAILTIGGIVIGVFALTVMGAMSEKLSLLVKGGVDYYSTKVTVVDGTSNAFGVGIPISLDKIAEIAKVEGVKYVSPSVGLLLDDEVMVSFGVPPMIYGDDPNVGQYESLHYDAIQGRLLTADDRGKAVVGSDLVTSIDAGVGKTIKLRGRDFEVVGILEKTLTAPDNSVMVSLPDAQELFMKTLPEVYAKSLEASKVASSFAVYLDDVKEGETVAKRIQEQVPNVKAYGPSFFKKQVGQATQIFSLIILSSALIAIVVGGLSIMNTLTFAVIERTREIGIKKAVGARAGRILREFIAEATTMGVIGGLVGIGLGVLAVLGINAGSQSKGLMLFLVTPRLLGGVFAFAILISIVAGYFPARRASRLNPVEALRYE